MEVKKALRRTGRSRPIMVHLVDSGAVTLDDIREAEQALLRLTEENPK